MPCASASVSTPSQAGEITPPRLATPTTSVLAPAAAASAMRHVGQAHVGVAAVHAVLADGGVGAPVADALGDLGRERVGGVAEEEEVGGLDHGASAKSRGGSRRDAVRRLKLQPQERAFRGGEHDQAVLHVAVAVEDVGEAARDEAVVGVDQAAVRADGHHREAAGPALHHELAPAPAAAEPDRVFLQRRASLPPPPRRILF